MISLRATKLIAVDVDDTLVMWNNLDDTYRPHHAHIEMVKKFHRRGHTIWVWSAGGEPWARRIVRELKLTRYVTIVSSKPDWFLDDKPASHFLPESNRIYLEDIK